ncbi:conserved hypothetical protein [Paenibacillus curdlanolyticus YK9]|uniref:Uracil-DNA glycosylase-like domain-containing protein n=1 Tax=Paenibacillus curdlanolyticus YK9 TaxID=717606 RepID=E0IG49_9BACL|nr:hypothetical protein [Paenibacillus curdlanolyticus]EFM08629.1 conserved hypothetical protein [Paenibacillus curdlanolyticus YK9]
MTSDISAPVQLEQLTKLWANYKPLIAELPAGRALTRDELLTPAFRVEQSGKLEMYYAPHNEHVNPAASVLIVGITPGWTQMRIAYETARKAMAEGASDEELFRRTKEAARFAGPMRANLIAMLNELGLQHYMQLDGCAALFEGSQELLHSISVLKYPVFFEGSNYTGARPPLLANAFLKERALFFMREELRSLARPALLIPLGKTVEGVLRLLAEEGELDVDACLWGFPHPSGANGHRHRQLAEGRASMRLIMERWFQAKE